MRLYEGMSRPFIEDAVRNQIADKLTDAFFNFYGFRPSFSEIASWRNSLRTMASVLDRGHMDDNGVILEYQLPLTSKRLDFLICGLDKQKKANAVIVELKQWEKCDSSDVDRCVSTWLGGSHRSFSTLLNKRRSTDATSRTATRPSMKGPPRSAFARAPTCTTTALSRAIRCSTRNSTGLELSPRSSPDPTLKS